MPGWLERLFGPAKPVRDYGTGPKLAGLDDVSERAIALQKRYWRLDPAEQAALEDRAAAEGLAALPWADALRLHQLRGLACLDADDGRLRRLLLAPDDERPAAAGDDPRDTATAGQLDAIQLAAIQTSARHLLSRRSPYRPRHGFAWLGAGPPAGDDIPYSDFQGRVVHAALTHLGSLEVITLDDRLEPAGLELIPFDEVQTLSLAPRTPAEVEAQPQAPALFRPARVIGEYGRADRLVLLPLRHGLSWFSYEPALLRGAGERAVAPVALAGLADPAKAVANPEGDRRSLSIGAGLQRLEILSDDPREGLGSFSLADCYQLSLAIDQDDPRFADKCRGRGLDPDATRGDVVREARLRASARARKRSS